MADFLVLDNRQKQMYDVILSAVQRGDTRITLDYIGDMGVVMEIVKIVLADFPELFYYDNCSIRYTFSNKGIILLLSKWVSESSVAVMNKALKTRVAEIVSSCIPAGMTEGQKALSLYRYMVNNIRYAENYSGQRPLPQLHTAYGAIVESNAVCEGIAAAYNLLLKAVNISATTVNGYVKPQFNSEITPFITRLTGITSYEVCEASGFEDALYAFEKWIGYVYSEIQNNDDMHRVTCQNCSIAMYSSHDYVLEKHTDSTYTEKGTDEYNCSLCNHKKTVLLDVIPDITPPTAEIDVSEKTSWQSFVETITFGVFCNGSDKIKICAEDDESGIAKIYYFISETPISEDALKEYELSEWTEYDKSFWFESEGNFIVYALLINNQGGQEIISSDGLVVDLTNPIITGVEEGKTYCVSASFTVIDSNIESILINDVALDTLSGEHTVSTSGENIIVATDKAGNTTTLRFFMENSHIYDEYESIDSEYHASKCDCGDEKIEKHSFGTWIQTKPSTTSERGEEKRVCMQCGYTEFKLLDMLVATKIEIANKPNTQYRYKQDFDIAGLTLTATYSDGSTKTITDTSKMTVTGYDKKKTGTQELTVKYENCEAKLAVTVKLTWWQWLIKTILFGWLWY